MSKGGKCRGCRRSLADILATGDFACPPDVFRTIGRGAEIVVMVVGQSALSPTALDGSHVDSYSDTHVGFYWWDEVCTVEPGGNERN